MYSQFEGTNDNSITMIYIDVVVNDQILLIYFGTTECVFNYYINQ